jgi:hypothetical protein
MHPSVLLDDAGTSGPIVTVVASADPAKHRAIAEAAIAANPPSLVASIGEPYQPVEREEPKDASGQRAGARL